jgi:hypothetical protein
MSDKGHISDVHHHPERRRHPRCKATIQVELQQQGVSAPLRSATDEISSGGCYIETMFTLAVGTRATVALWLDSVKVTAQGVVATCYPQVGNGIEFVGMSAEDRKKLEHFLAEHAHPGPRQA